MRKALPVFLFLCLVPTAAFCDEGKVVLVTTECHDYFVVDTGGSRYALLQWYGGPMPEKGDKLSGDFIHFGVHDLQLLPNGQRIRAWLNDYDLSKDDLNDKLADKCSQR